MTKNSILLPVVMLIVACGGNDAPPVWVADQTYADLEWSLLSEKKMTHGEAFLYCEAMEARLPNINELRKVVINCPNTEYGGMCQISDPDCLDYHNCWVPEDCHCDGSAESYSALGDGKDIWLWSSSHGGPGSEHRWAVRFDNGLVIGVYGGQSTLVRCVR